MLETELPALMKIMVKMKLCKRLIYINVQKYVVTPIIFSHQFYNFPTGIVTRPGVEVKTKLTTDVWEQYKLDTTVEVKNNNNFFRPLEKLLNGGSCGAGCNADVVTCPA